MSKKLNAFRPEPKYKHTAQGTNKKSVKTSSMNKSKRLSFKPYRGQGR